MQSEYQNTRGGRADEGSEVPEKTEPRDPGGGRARAPPASSAGARVASGATNPPIARLREHPTATRVAWLATVVPHSGPQNARGAQAGRIHRLAGDTQPAARTASRAPWRLRLAVPRHARARRRPAHLDAGPDVDPPARQVHAGSSDLGLGTAVGVVACPDVTGANRHVHEDAPRRRPDLHGPGQRRQLVGREDVRPCPDPPAGPGSRSRRATPAASCRWRSRGPSARAA